MRGAQRFSGREVAAGAGVILAAAVVILVAGLLGRRAGRGPFSHRQHLAQPGMTCAACHDSVQESTAAADDNLPPGEACLPCHDDSYRPLVRSGPAPVRSYRFSHKFHLGLGSVAPILAAAIDGGIYLGEGASLRAHLEGADACAACHRGVNEADRVTAAHLPRMADCLVCHRNIDPPWSCAFCHTENAVLEPASHTAQFADRHSSPEIPKADCKICHGTRFTCMGCH